MKRLIYCFAIFLLSKVSDIRADTARINNPSLRLFLDLSNGTALLCNFGFSSDEKAIAAYEKLTKTHIADKIGFDKPSWNLIIDEENQATYTTI
jgi:hypothetical protein